MQNGKWWLDNKYWEKSMDMGGFMEPKLDEIIAEATRRGELKAWKEAMEVADNCLSIGDWASTGEYIDHSELEDAIEEKIKSLSNSQV